MEELVWDFKNLGGFNRLEKENDDRDIEQVFRKFKNL